MWGDCKHACRQLARSPVFSAVAILTLALCIGANSAIFSVVHAVLYKWDPWPEADRLVLVSNSYPGLNMPEANVSIPDYLDRREQVRGLAEAALYFRSNLNFAGEGAEPQQVAGLCTTPSLFRTLRSGALLGRTLTEEDAAPGAPPVVVIGHDLWRNLFGSDPGIVGRRIRFNGAPVTVVGVMPAGFYFPDPGVQAWTPFAFTPAQRSDSERGHEYASMIARLRPGATLAQVRQDLLLLQARNEARLTADTAFWRATRFHGEATGYRDAQVRDVRGTLWLVQGAVAAALLIGCANVAGLLLARAVSRERELAIRSALGAGRGRLVRLLVVESAVLFAAGAALGLLAAWWGLAALQQIGFTELPRADRISIDASVVAFTIGSAAVAAVVFGAAPGWFATGSRAAESLKEAGTRGGTAGRRTVRVRYALVAGEIALAVMLLTTATLLVKSFERLESQNPGFAAGGVLTAELALPTGKYADSGRAAAFCRTLMTEVAAAPGVKAAGLVDVLPFSGNDAAASYSLPGLDFPTGTPPPHGNIRRADSGYLAALGLTLLRGRWFTPADAAGAQPVVVVDRLMADRYWRGRNPLGRQVSVLGGQPAVIVGVVAPVKNSGFDDVADKETIYLPLAQSPALNLTAVVRAEHDPAQVVAAFRSALRSADPEQPIRALRTMRERLDQSLQRRRAPMVLVSALGAIALLLACLGIYGVLSFSAAQRQPEFGVRIALGATAGDIVRLVLRQAAAITAAGVGAGLAGYFLLSRIVGRLLFGVGALDGTALAGVPLLLAAVALAASLLPAVRSSRADPITALRSE